MTQSLAPALQALPFHRLLKVIDRVGDSCTPLIALVRSNFALCLTFMHAYAPKGGIGPLTAAMLPYSGCFLLGWGLLLPAWLTLGLPIGSLASVFLTK